MRLSNLQLIIGLFAAVALCIAFMAIGAGVVALLLAVIGSAAVGWLVWSLLRRYIDRARNRPA